MTPSRLGVAIMRRRSFLRSAGLVTGLGLAGCLGDSPPEAANEFGYPTTMTEGIAVPLVPLADATQWYEDDIGVFADARSRTAFEQARIAGAVHSPAPDGLASNDPIAGRPKDTRVVTYCGCPHHLSTLRGATLIQNGYVHTYAIDEGFHAWRRAGYPLEGESIENTPQSFTITGRTDPAAAGEMAWAWHDPSGQREATPITTDGQFAIHVQFYDVTPESRIRLTTPAGELTDSLGVLSSGNVEVD